MIVAATTIPVLPSRSFDDTAAFYARLGFAEQARYPGEYLILSHRLGIELHFWSKPGLAPAATDTGCYVRFATAAEARELHDEWAAVGLDAHHLLPPEETDYGLLEFAVLDTDRNLVRVGGVLT